MVTVSHSRPLHSQQRSDGYATAALLLDDGSLHWGWGFGASGMAVGEVCFNTGMSGYQETLSDPSFAAQIITFTAAHIGNVGSNDEDFEAKSVFAQGLVLRNLPTNPANWRSSDSFPSWCNKQGLVGIAGIDCRALTQRIRNPQAGVPNAVIIHAPDGKIDLKVGKAKLDQFGGLEGLDLAATVSTRQSYSFDQTRWNFSMIASDLGFGIQKNPTQHIVVIDYGVKTNILRCLASVGFRITVVPANTSAAEIFALNPDGLFLTNGPGDPAATAAYAVPILHEVLNRELPLMGICLGHQLLGLAIGGKTRKMAQGHRGANHPVKELASGKVTITSQNHGFELLAESLPLNAEVTHISLFDKSLEGFRIKNAPVFAVQYHPEASPGPHDSLQLFDQFKSMVEK